MTDLKASIDERLWNYIKKNYLSDHFSDSILDAIQYLGDVIREKSGLLSDGQQLIGAAFGGKNPLIKSNKLQTESEKAFQAGLEFLLRGVYSAFRNPRSHERFEDTQQDAFTIILFIDYILKWIDQSRGKFSVQDFISRVIDDDFVSSAAYAEALICEVPANKIYETSIELFKSKSLGRPNHISLVLKKLLDKLSDDEKSEVREIASEELRYTSDMSDVIRIVAIYDAEWKHLAADAKMRAENKLIKNLRKAQTNTFGKDNQEAIYASWIPYIISDFELKLLLSECIYDILKNGTIDQLRFVINSFGPAILDLSEPLFEDLESILKDRLEAGSLEIFHFITECVTDEKLKEKLAGPMEKFRTNMEDLPF